MRKLLIYCLAINVLLVVGCSSKAPKEETESLWERLWFIYKPEIQQGNIINQEMVDKLRPGMDKRQVRFVMGTPLLVDVFHQDRWDYYYSLKLGHEPITKRRLGLYFEDNRLLRIVGDLHPEPSNELEKVADPVIEVPDYEPEHKGIITRIIDVLKGK